jgi:hypothetical protein
MQKAIKMKAGKNNSQRVYDGERSNKNNKTKRGNQRWANSEN